MRAYDQGSLVRVTASENEVAAFKSRWPCSGLPTRAFWCVMDKRNGDLVDIRDGFDGDAACALVDDCKAYARSRIPSFDALAPASTSALGA